MTATEPGLDSWLGSEQRVCPPVPESRQIHAVAIHRTGCTRKQVNQGREEAVPKGWERGTQVGLVTGGRHDDEAVGERHGGVVDLDGDAPAGARDPAHAVEVAAQLRHQLPRLPHRIPRQVRLRRRPRRRPSAAPARHLRLPRGSLAAASPGVGGAGCSVLMRAGAARLVPVLLLLLEVLLLLLDGNDPPSYTRHMATGTTSSDEAGRCVLRKLLQRRREPRIEPPIFPQIFFYFGSF
jgi:hypothetical protein